MFREASTFNGNIGAWNTAQVTNFNGMFLEAKQFNQDIGGWDTSNVISMAWMFYEASVFQQNISTWDSSKVTSFKKMFGLATAFRLKWECEIAGPPSSCTTLRSDWIAPPPPSPPGWATRFLTLDFLGAIFFWYFSLRKIFRRKQKFCSIQMCSICYSCCWRPRRLNRKTWRPSRGSLHPCFGWVCAYSYFRWRPWRAKVFFFILSFINNI